MRMDDPIRHLVRLLRLGTVPPVSMACSVCLPPLQRFGVLLIVCGNGSVKIPAQIIETILSPEWREEIAG